jgi:hypothetical protein
MYSGLTVPPSLLALADEVMNNDPFLLHCMSPLLALRVISLLRSKLVASGVKRTSITERDL